MLMPVVPDCIWHWLQWMPGIERGVAPTKQSLQQSTALNSPISGCFCCGESPTAG
jgi:hypothetical protein